MTTRWPAEQPVLADDHVAFRGCEPIDAEPVFLACQDSAIQYFTQVPVPYLKEHEEFLVAQAPGKWTAQAAAGFAVVDRASGDLVGACGLVEGCRA